MFDSSDFGPRAISNPGTLQKAALDEIQTRLNGQYIFADPNNGFNLLLEFGSSCTAQMVRAEDGVLAKIYPGRAQTAADLYGHMSDFDYVNLTASPAKLQFRLVLSKPWIVANAVSYDDNYDLIQIPDTTKIVMGSYTFGLYYPINYLVNKITGAVSVFYDIDTANPLLSMSTNQPYDVSEYTVGGLTLVAVVFDAYQFATQVIPVTLDSDTGWIATYAYSNQFYAARCYTYLNSEWVELSYSLSQMSYDPSTPTVLITILDDIQNVQFQIPQIYFTNGQIGTQVKIQLFTTMGALDTGILAADANAVEVNFDVGSSVYAAPLAQPPVLSLTPYNTTVLSGGSNALDFATLRERVVNGTLYDDTPITPLQLSAAASKLGFDLTKYIDNITDRIYYASAPLVTTDGKTVPIAVSGILLNSTSLSATSTIISFSDGLYTIMPTTMFQYDQDTSISTPLSDTQVASLNALSNIDKASEMNDNTYTQQPFHVVLSATSTPSAKSFNLMSPVQTGLIFDRENVASAAQLSITNAVVTHQDNGTGGYIITLGVKRSNPILQTDPSNFKIVLMATARSGSTVSAEAVYMSTNTATGVDVYAVVIPTNYHISLDGYIQTTLTEGSQLDILNEIPLTTAFDVRLMVLQSLYPTIAQDTQLIDGLPVAYDGYLVVAKQTLTIQFGQDLSDYIFNPVDTTWGAQAYSTWGEDQYYTYSTDQYLKSGGIPVYPLIKIASAGDNVLNYLETLSVTASQEVDTGGDTIPLSSVSGILVGASVAGTGIPSGATVSQVSSTGITISAALTATLPANSIVVVGGGMPITTTVSTAQTVVGASLTVASSAVLEGMTAYGVGIPYGTTVLSVSGQTVTLSASTTAIMAANAVVYFANQTTAPSVQYDKGTIRLDASGNPILVTDRTNVYRVTAMQTDARLYASQAETDVAYVDSIPTDVTSMAMSLDTLRDQLLERTYLYYNPSRTMGTASFNVGNGSVSTMNLGLSLNIVIGVTTATKSNTALCDLMESSTISTATTYISGNNLINSDALSKLISSALGTPALAVGVSAINNQQGLRIIQLEDTGVQASPEYILSVAADGTLEMVPNVTVSFVTFDGT